MWKSRAFGCSVLAALRSVREARPERGKLSALRVGERGTSRPNAQRTKRRGAEGGQGDWRSRAIALCAEMSPEEPVSAGENRAWQDAGKWGSFSATGILSSEDGVRGTSVRILRDTGSSHTLVRAAAAPNMKQEGKTGESLVMSSAGGSVVVHVVALRLEMDGLERRIMVGVTEDMPVKGVDILLGNYMGRGLVDHLWKEEGESRSRRREG